MSSEFPTSVRRDAYDIGALDADSVDASEEREVLADRAPDGVRRRSYDTAFEPAVAEGLLTVQDAWARGSREAYSVGLQRRYELTSALALDVADNRLSLHEALETLDRQASGTLFELMDTNRRERWFWLPVAVVIAGSLLFLGRYGDQMWEHQVRIARELEQRSLTPASRPAAASARKQPIAASTVGLKVLRDAYGRVTRVSAGKPVAVLEEICRLASESGSCAWKELRQLQPRHAGHRNGRFAAAREGGEIWVVRIHLNRSSGRWIAGTGLRPLEPVPDGMRERPILVPAPAHAPVLSAARR
jgi:hypothetical protein